jgi:hypothetical protein
MDFQEIDRVYDERKRQYDNGSLSKDQFEAWLKDEAMVQDAQDRWWSKHRETGEWHRFDPDTGTWIKDTPPHRGQPEPPSPSILRSPSISRGWRELLSYQSLFVLLLIVIAIFILVLLRIIVA